MVGAVEALDGLGLEGDAFMPGFEEAFPVMEVIEVQAGVAAVQEGVRGAWFGGNGLESPFYGCEAGGGEGDAGEVGFDACVVEACGEEP